MFYGHSDLPLSARGRDQSAAVARALAAVPLAAIYSSDLERTAECAALLGRHEGRPAPVALSALREMHLGVLERVSFRDARARVPELAHLGYDDLLDHGMPGGGESVRDLAARVVPCVAALIVRHARPPDQPRQGPPPAIVIVAHNTVNRVLLAHAAGLGPGGYTRFEQALGSLSRIDLRDTWSADDPWRSTRIGLVNWTPEPAFAGAGDR
jgi:broad specificity phosphatase PhoE